MRYQPNNQITLLINGTDYFPALLRAIDAAREEIFLESYLFEADVTGRQVSARLMRAARRGVRVQLLIDGFGAGDLPWSLRRSFARAGVRLLFFRPEVSRLSLKRQRLRRMHRKLAAIDNRIGFVGGINILDDIDQPDWPPRYDYALRIEGPLAAELRLAAVKLWRQECWRQLKRDWSRLPRRMTLPPPAGEVSAALVIRDNFRHRRAIENAYLDAIRQARHEIVLANAYFLPGRSFRAALVAAAQRGVRVVVLLQGQVDNPLIHYATRDLYRHLVDAGVEIHEYVKGLMHAKVAVIDRLWVTVGSSNIDPFSLMLAREANVVVQHAPLAAELRKDLQRAIESDCQQVVPASLVKAPWWRRLVPWCAYLLVRLLMEMTGYGHREYREE
ncbi:cardiolipin synthase ClsB [Chitinimonas lacunae]|uniref:Cardiolipin synthase B n=1 Tax=Chitinimonas lacunae TaxID=1963018 RepID=A0ABV8MPU0_9NEIS